MRSSALYVLTATLAAISSSCYPVGAATLTVHTQAPKVNVHVPTPKVPVQSSSGGTHVVHHDITITKRFDKSTPKLYDAKTQKPDEHPKESVTIEFGEVMH